MARPRASSILVATPLRVLEAAEDIFGRSGFPGAKLADIAQRAGIRRASLLHHFRSKEILYDAVVERVFSRLGDALRAAMRAKGSFESRLRAMVQAFAGFLDRYPALAPVLVRQLLETRGPGREILLKQVSPLLDVVERFVRVEGRSEIRPKLPIRAAVLQVVSGILLRAASGELRRPLWGKDDQTWAVVRHLFFGPAPAAPAALPEGPTA